MCAVRSGALAPFELDDVAVAWAPSEAAHETVYMEADHYGR